MMLFRGRKGGFVNKVVRIFVLIPGIYVLYRFLVWLLSSKYRQFIGFGRFVVLSMFGRQALENYYLKSVASANSDGGSSNAIDVDSAYDANAKIASQE